MAKAAKAVQQPAPEPEIYLVKFNKLCAPYNAGEVAGFSKKAAAEYLRRGVATIYTAPAHDPATGPTPDPQSYAKTLNSFGTDVPPGINPTTGETEGVMSSEEAEALLTQTATVTPSGGPDDDL